MHVPITYITDPTNDAPGRVWDSLIPLKCPSLSKLGIHLFSSNISSLNRQFSQPQLQNASIRQHQPPPILTPTTWSAWIGLGRSFNRCSCRQSRLDSSHHRKRARGRRLSILGLRSQQSDSPFQWGHRRGLSCHWCEREDLKWRSSCGGGLQEERSVYCALWW
jgi:hypothetical protein